MLIEEFQAQPEADTVDVQLSVREQEVIQLIALGYTASEAAETLALSPKSVETYRTRIMHKLGLHNRVDLVQYALFHGLLKEDLDESS